MHMLNSMLTRTTLIVATLFATSATAADKMPLVPDFSGLWGRNALGFELPRVGPGPVRNRMRRPDGSQNGSALVGDYTNPMLKPNAAQVLKRLGEMAVSTPFADPLNQCGPMPPPYILVAQLGFQMLQDKDQITFIYFDDHQVRRVRLNASHEPFMRSSEGDSVGHYEGDTLVVDTVGIKTGPLSMIDRLGTPFSEALHVVERYRLIDAEATKEAIRTGELETSRINEFTEGVTIDPDYGRGLQIEVTVEDPGVFIQSWSGLVTFRHALGGFPEFVCAENPHEFDRRVDLPFAGTPDF